MHNSGIVLNHSSFSLQGHRELNPTKNETSLCDSSLVTIEIEFCKVECP